MAVGALILLVGYLTLAFGLRAWLHHRRTGDTGFRGISGRPGTAGWWAGVLFATALVVGALGPVAALAGLDPLSALIAPPVQGAGVVLALAGAAATFAAQLGMGSSWRVGVDPTERTALITTGAFALVRNPIFTAMTLTSAGLALMVPNVLALTGAALLVIAVQLQVRVVEEPYLLRAHPDEFRRYAARTGRFLPRIGLLEAPGHHADDSARR